MEAQPYLSGSSGVEPQSGSTTTTSFAWLDIAYGVLFVPGKTLEILSNPSIYKTGKPAFFRALFAFFLSGLTANAAKSMLMPDIRSLPDFVIFNTAMGLITWFALAIFLQFVARLLNRTVNNLTALIVTGWAFLPLIFIAPIGCLVLANIVFRLFLLVPCLWVSYLQILAFDSVLKLGKAKTLSLFVVVPPVIFLILLFWLAPFCCVLLSLLIG
jgi:hypothetical protein